MRSSRSHPILHDFEGIRSHNPTKLLLLTIVLNKYVLVNLALA